MSTRSSYPRRLRKRLNRWVYGVLFRAYRTVFPTPVWRGYIPPRQLRRLLIVQHYGVGDMILTTPLIGFLKDRAPDAEIDVLASPRNAAVIADDDRVAHIFIHDHTWPRWLSVLRELRARRYDAVFCGQAGKGLAEGLTASLAARRGTYKLSVWRPKRYQGLFTAVTRVRPGAMHTAEQVLHLGYYALGARAMPVGSAGHRFPLRMARDARAEERVAAFIDECKLGAFAVVNVSAQFASRDWAPEHCARSVQLLLQEYPDVTVVVTPAPGKVDAAAEVVRRSQSVRVVLAPVFSLLELAALVRRAGVIVSTNTALVHLASACGRPVVALYAPPEPDHVGRWLPLGVPYRALASRVGGTLGDIAPESVADAVAGVLRESHSPSEPATAPAAR